MIDLDGPGAGLPAGLSATRCPNARPPISSGSLRVGPGRNRLREGARGAGSRVRASCRRSAMESGRCAGAHRHRRRGRLGCRPPYRLARRRRTSRRNGRSAYARQSTKPRGSTPTASSTPSCRSCAQAGAGRGSRRISARRSIRRPSLPRPAGASGRPRPHAGQPRRRHRRRRRDAGLHPPPAAGDRAAELAVVVGARPGRDARNRKHGERKPLHLRNVTNGPVHDEPGNAASWARDDILSPQSARPTKAPPSITITSPGAASSSARCTAGCSPDGVCTVNAGPASRAPRHMA